MAQKLILYERSIKIKLNMENGGGAQNVINARNTTKLDNCVAFNCRFFVPLNVIVTDNT